MKLSEAWAAYEADKRIEGYSPHTIKAYTIQSRLMIRHFGDVGLEEISLPLLKEYLAKDAVRLKPASIGHRVRFLKSLFRWALDEGYVQPNPAAKLKEPKQGIRIPKSMTEEDIEFLREACQSPLEHALVELLYATGCRIGEVYRMDRRDIDWDKRSIIVIGKGNKEREVYFDTKCGIWLRRYFKTRKDTNPAVFVTERKSSETGQQWRMSIAHMRYHLKLIAKRTEENIHIYPHKFRHSFATHLLNNGAPLEVIQSFLGHTKLETTMLYAQLSGEHRREAYRKYR